MLALETSLISQYFAFSKIKQGSYDREIIEKLFKYLQPFTMSIAQKDEIGLNDALVQALSGSGLIKIRNRTNEDILIEKTKLKLMLTTGSQNGSFPYPYINILNDEVDVNFTATYKSGEDRDKAVEHIQALLKDTKSIKIYDKYLTANSSWHTNKQVLLNILPQKVITIDIYCDVDWNLTCKNDLTRACMDWTIDKKPWDNTMHDRYIETDKVIILLSSGIINLRNNATKDFTYIVKIK